MMPCPAMPEIKTLRDLFGMGAHMHNGLEVVTTLCPVKHHYVAYLRVVQDTYGLHPLDMDTPRQYSEAALLGRAWEDRSMATWFPYVVLGKAAGIGLDLLSDWFSHVVVKEPEVLARWLDAVGDYTRGLEFMQSMENASSIFGQHEVIVAGRGYGGREFLIDPNRILRDQVGVRIQDHEPLQTWGGDVDIFNVEETAKRIAYEYLAEKGFKEEVVKIAERLKGTGQCSFKVDFNFTNKGFRDEIRPRLVQRMSNAFDLTPEVFFIDTRLVGDETIEFEIFVNYDPAWEPETLAFIRTVLENAPWFSLYIPEHQEMLLKGARNSCYRRTNAALLKGHEQDLIKAVEKDFGRVVLSPNLERKVREDIRGHLSNIEKFKCMPLENQEQVISGIRAVIPRHAEHIGSAHRLDVITAWHEHMMDRTTW